MVGNSTKRPVCKTKRKDWTKEELDSNWLANWFERNILHVSSHLETESFTKWRNGLIMWRKSCSLLDCSHRLNTKQRAQTLVSKECQRHQQRKRIATMRADRYQIYWCKLWYKVIECCKYTESIFVIDSILVSVVDCCGMRVGMVSVVDCCGIRVGRNNNHTSARSWALNTLTPRGGDSWNEWDFALFHRSFDINRSMFHGRDRPPLKLLVVRIIRSEFQKPGRSESLLRT